MNTADKQINIVIAESSPLIAAGLADIFGQFKGMRVAETVRDISFLEDAVIRHSPHAIILDPMILPASSRAGIRNTMPYIGKAAVACIATTLPEESLSSQFDTMLSIYDTAASIARKIRKAVHDSSPSVSEPRKDYDLSDREKEILVAVAKGKTNKEIADQFCISVYTVISHRKNITQKTGIKTIAGLTVYAILNGMIEME